MLPSLAGLSIGAPNDGKRTQKERDTAAAAIAAFKKWEPNNEVKKQLVKLYRNSVRDFIAVVLNSDGLTEQTFRRYWANFPRPFKKRPKTLRKRAIFDTWSSFHEVTNAYFLARYPNASMLKETEPGPLKKIPSRSCAASGAGPSGTQQQECVPGVPIEHDEELDGPMLEAASTEEGSDDDEVQSTVVGSDTEPPSGEESDDASVDSDDLFEEYLAEERFLTLMGGDNWSVARDFDKMNEDYSEKVEELKKKRQQRSS